jgi:hypothetical protein
VGYDVYLGLHSRGLTELAGPKVGHVCTDQVGAVVASFVVSTPDYIVGMERAVRKPTERPHGVLCHLFCALCVASERVDRAVLGVVIVTKPHLLSFPNTVGNTQYVVDNIGKFGVKALHVAPLGTARRAVEVVVHKSS